jgi:hypothetical protein
VSDLLKSKELTAVEALARPASTASDGERRAVHHESSATNVRLRDATDVRLRDAVRRAMSAMAITV